ncbi:hypothetical protein BGX38DRAFT_1164842 [Terfezia claveryi]|nr:hypothetical protein BGX38DRAFT_1164842 [Terfezia claveryi]
MTHSMRPKTTSLMIPPMSTGLYHHNTTNYPNTKIELSLNVSTLGGHWWWVSFVLGFLIPISIHHRSGRSAQSRLDFFLLVLRGSFNLLITLCFITIPF